jgi:hypothetical protein
MRIEPPQMLVIAYRASTVMTAGRRLRIVIQYVTALPDARSTATSHSSWGLPGPGDTGTTVQITFQAAGHPHVNQVWEELPPTVPLNCVPTTMMSPQSNANTV